MRISIGTGEYLAIATDGMTGIRHKNALVFTGREHSREGIE